jgi:ADP-L-glycero-D-manno-heptose 6-epimerase
LRDVRLSFEEKNMYLVTGGAGFIGSNIAASLEKQGADVAIMDWVGGDDYKWRNIAKRRLIDIVTPEQGPAWLEKHKGAIEGVVHMGAISTTTETDVDKIVRNNFRLSVDLWSYCAEQDIPFVYASSAATYGDGENGFADRFDEAYLSSLRPLNPYGWSKHLFDRWALRAIETDAPRPPRWAGLKFFNVYGPNEYHKGGQRSVAVQLHEQIRERGSVRLFKSDNPAYGDGEQQRDFVWVGDCVNVALWALQDAAAPSDLYNVGSGAARCFLDKAKIIFAEMNRELQVQFIDLPPNLRGKYQYYTCADMAKLRRAGFDKQLTTLEAGLGLYVHQSLETADSFI